MTPKLTSDEPDGIFDKAHGITPAPVPTIRGDVDLGSLSTEELMKLAGRPYGGHFIDESQLDPRPLSPAEIQHHRLVMNSIYAGGAVLVTLVLARWGVPKLWYFLLARIREMSNAVRGR